jgi:hypothetical protein
VNWDFLQRYDESWIWRRADRRCVTESTRNFAALDECIEDAARHGYAGPSPETRRRTTAQSLRAIQARKSRGPASTT